MMAVLEFMLMIMMMLIMNMMIMVVISMVTMVDDLGLFAKEPGSGQPSIPAHEGKHGG